MNTKDVSDLLLKVGGIIIVVTTVPYIHNYVMIYAQFQEKSLSLFISTIIAPSIFPLLVGFFMFIKPDKITDKMVVGGQLGEGGEQHSSLAQIERACLVTLGFYLLFQSASDLVFHISNFIQAKASYRYQGTVPGNSLIFTPVFIATLFELVFALWLIFKVKGILAFVGKMRG